VLPEAVEQELEVLEVDGRPFVVQPFFECAVEALELAERLRVGGGGVDQLDTCLGQPALEGDLLAEQATGEACVVVGEQLAREAVGGAGAAEQAQAASPLGVSQASAASR
jgi:hypothetical protein